jgi:signal transduction histidine kinase
MPADEGSAAIGKRASRGAAPDSTAPPAAERYPVLLVEDDASLQPLVLMLLRHRGYTVHVFSNAEAALERSRQITSPIVVVVDRTLPGMSGTELVERLRVERQDFEVVLMTAYADVTTLVASMRLGVFRCVLKPFQQSDLLSAVAGAANRLALRLDLRARTRELEERNAQLEEMVKRLRHADERHTLGERLASIGRLAAGVAHEINTPLAAAIANMALVAEELPRLLREDDPRRAFIKDALGDAREAAERVRIIVRDLKTFSRGDDETIGSVDLRRVVEAALNMVKNEIRHRARLVKDYGPTPAVKVNEARLGQVVLNLLLNAAQAIPEGDASHNEIRIVTAVLAEHVSLEVHDTGSGMPPEVVARIFDPFYTTKPVGFGTGLGLSICHGIVAAFGGHIQVESRPGRGSTFRVLLPVAAEVGEQAPPSIPLGAVPRARVLAIDDDALIVNVLKRVLGSCCDLEAVTSVRAARTLLAEREFDVILCDLMMPETTGMDFHEELMASSPRQAESMIFLTGGTFTSRAQAFLDGIPNLRLEKPFDPQQLRDIVRERAPHRAVTPAASGTPPVAG